MSNVRALLARVAKLEQRTTAPRSIIEKSYGSLEAFELSIQKRVENGELDTTELPLVLQGIRSWHLNGCFGQWTRSGVWEYAGKG